MSTKVLMLMAAVTLCAGVLYAAGVDRPLTQATQPDVRPLTPALSPEYRGEGEGGRRGEDDLANAGGALDPRVSFRAVEVFVDAKDIPLAAYQVEVVATAGQVALVGVEGGKHPAFNPAPYYDKRAERHNRVIIAGFSTAADLPVGRTLVARLMMQVSGDVEPVYKGTLHVAGNPAGDRVPAELILVPLPPAAAPAGSEGVQP